MPAMGGVRRSHPPVKIEIGKSGGGEKHSAEFAPGRRFWEEFGEC